MYRSMRSHVPKQSVYHQYSYPISIIHPRCIKVGLQWCTVFIADFGFFASYRLRQKRRHDSGRAKPPPWSRRVTLVPLPKQKYIYIYIIWPDFGRSYRHLSFSKSQWKTGHFTLLYYIWYHLYLIRFRLATSGIGTKVRWYFNTRPRPYNYAVNPDWTLTQICDLTCIHRRWTCFDVTGWTADTVSNLMPLNQTK